MASKFKSGLLLGGLLAAGVAVGLSMNKEGAKLTKELQEDLKALTKNLKKNLDSVQEVSKENFNEVVTKVVDEHASKLKLASSAKKKIVTALQGMWQEVEEEAVEQSAKIPKKPSKKTTK